MRETGPICGKLRGLKRVCNKPPGHSGEHRFVASKRLRRLVEIDVTRDFTEPGHPVYARRVPRRGNRQR